MIPCMSKKYLGIECLGCGAQRAISLVFRGEFLEAFHLFPAVYTLLLFFIFVGLHFLDKARNYHQLIISTAIINALVMIISFSVKHFF